MTTLAYGTVMLLPRLLRAIIGVDPCTPPTSDALVDAGCMAPLRFGTVPGVKEPPAHGLEFGVKEVAIWIWQERGTQERQRLSFSLF